MEAFEDFEIIREASPRFASYIKVKEFRPLNYLSPSLWRFLFGRNILSSRALRA